MGKKKHRSGRNKQLQEKVKQQLFDKYSFVCWLCNKQFKRQELTIHHIIEHQYSHHTVELESCILCTHCHFGIVNKVVYQSEEYNKLMDKVEEFRKSKI
jgi:transcription elongation factor Elf1